MVNLRNINEMTEYWDSHLKEWVRDHKGEYVLIERGKGVELKHTIFGRKRDYERAREPYRDVIGPGVVGGRIPMRYKKPWSLKTLEEQADEAHRDTAKYLRKLDEFEKRSRKSKLCFD